MQLLVNILHTSSLLIIISYSFTLIFYTTRFFNLAHAAIITFAAYLTYQILATFNLSIICTVSLAAALSILIGVSTEKFIFKPLRKKHTPPFGLLIASLGLYTILQNLISIIWGNDTKSINTGEIKMGNEFLGAHITDIQIITILLSIFLFVLSILFLNNTKLGRHIRAVSSNEQLSNILGIDSGKVIMCAFGIGSGLASVAGILVAFDTNITPTMGFNLLLYGIVTMIIGGVSSTWGLVGGALLIATSQHLGAYFIDSKWMDAIVYFILILFLIWKPLGLSGKQLKKTEI